ncbi:hypothetical protein CEP54_010490 [Fusarium duplospermum]|uniref:C2H2-type domain-containing protein n=1 Tax=Fusarium duplospermum TaxID=1325734 RepID=A0A428PJN9_9HYPO|nr:hypothetical protein CEP54_010490 [Fusarium duplospermum]
MDNDTPGPVSASIFEATQATHHTLESCKSVEVQRVRDWAENRILDFNLWAAGIGALSTSRSSLDKRIASQPAVRSVVLGLLSALKTLTQHCLDLGSGPTSNSSPYFVQDGDEPDLDGSSSEQSDTFAPWSDNSDSEETGQKPCKSLLEQAMAETDSVLSQLIRVGKVIRAAGTVSRLRRADGNFSFEDYQHLEDEGYKQSPKVDIEDLRALKAHLMTVLFAQPPENVTGLRLVARNPWSFETDFNNLQDHHRSTIEQLCFANLLRRNRFNYAKRHAEKLASSSESRAPQDLKPTANETTHGKDATGPTDRVTSLDQASKSGTGSLPFPDLRQQGLMSETTPSEGTVDARALKRAADSQVALSRKSVSLDKSGWPHPPALSRNRASFRCPCCHQILPSEESKQLLWRKHLSSDLFPFTCIFPGCSKGVSLFVSRSEWKAHMQQEHKSSTFWECFACTDAETSTIFHSPEEFIGHMHSHVTNNEDLLKLLRVCQRTKPLAIEACPLCVIEPQDNDLDPGALLEHIADHVHDFSLASLPWADKPPETMPRPQEQVLQKVRNWLDDAPMDRTQDPEERGPPPSVALLDYFAESAGASSRADCSSPAHSNRSLDSIPGVEETRQKRTTVIIVVSATSIHSMLDMLQPPNFSAVKLLVLIYFPGLHGHTDIESALQSLPERHSYRIAWNLVENETMVIPFTTFDGHSHILRMLKPDIIYLQEALTSDDGQIASKLQTWYRNDLIVVFESFLITFYGQDRHLARIDQWRAGGASTVYDNELFEDWSSRVLSLE